MFRLWTTLLLPFDAGSALICGLVESEGVEFPVPTSLALFELFAWLELCITFSLFASALYFLEMS